MDRKSKPGKSSRRRKAFSIPIISISEVEKKIGDPGFCPLDCTSYNSYRLNHIPGARYIGSVYCVSELPPDKDSVLVFYSTNPQHKVTAYRAAKKAHEVGYMNVFIMRAGISGWLLLKKQTIGYGGKSLTALQTTDTYAKRLLSIRKNVSGEQTSLKQNPEPGFVKVCKDSRRKNQTTYG